MAIHQSFIYFCQLLVNLWLSQDVFQMSTISLQANLYSSGKVVNHFYTLLFRDGSYFCCDDTSSGTSEPQKTLFLLLTCPESKKWASNENQTFSRKFSSFSSTLQNHSHIVTRFSLSASVSCCFI